jgi:hypothetical protein
MSDAWIFGMPVREEASEKSERSGESRATFAEVDV